MHRLFVASVTIYLSKYRIHYQATSQPKVLHLDIKQLANFKDDSRRYLVIRYPNSQPQTTRKVAQLVKRLKQLAKEQPKLGHIMVVKDDESKYITTALKVPQLQYEQFFSPNNPDIIKRLAKITQYMQKNQYYKQTASILNFPQSYIYVLTNRSLKKRFKKQAAQMLSQGWVDLNSKFIIAKQQNDSFALKVANNHINKQKGQFIKVQQIKQKHFRQLKIEDMKLDSCPQLHVISSAQVAAHVIKKANLCKNIKNKTHLLTVKKELNPQSYQYSQKLAKLNKDCQIILIKPGFGTFFPHLYNGNPDIVKFRQQDADQKGIFKLHQKSSRGYKKQWYNEKQQKWSDFNIINYPSLERISNIKQLKQRIQQGKRTVFKTKGTRVNRWKQQVLVIDELEIDLIPGIYLFNEGKIIKYDQQIN